MPEIPVFPSFRPVNLEDKKILSEYLKDSPPQISEYTFTNLYVWRKSDETQLSKRDNVLLVKVLKYPDSREVLLPPLGSNDIAQTSAELVRDIKDRTLPPFYGISKDQAEALAKTGFSVKLDRDNSDYVYLMKDLSELPGTKYHPKRQAIRRCLAEHKCEYVPITPDTAELCLELQEEWCNLVDCNKSQGLREEDQAIKEAFLHYERLSVFGGAITVDGRLQAFTLGEKLSNDTAVIHFEKANLKVRGLYQLVNNWFCKNALSDYTYVNREQDLGEAGLRRAKEGYHPHHLVEKYIAERT